MDLEVADIKTQWQEVNANSRMLTGTIKVDWVERYPTALPTLRQGVIAGVFQIKGAAPWAITRAEKL